MFAAVALVAFAGSSPGVSAKGFDGVWSVSITADDEKCPTKTIPVEVSDGTISFSAFGATATVR